VTDARPSADQANKQVRRGLGEHALRCATRVGIDPDEIFDRATFSARNPRPGPYFTLAFHQQLLLTTQELVADPQFGLKTGGSTPMEAFGVVGHLMGAAQHALAAFEHLARFNRLIGPDRNLSVHNDSRGGLVALAPVANQPHLVPVCHHLMAGHWAQLVRRMTDDRQRPIGVDLPGDPAPHRDQLEAFLGCPVRFNQPALVLRFAPGALTARTPWHDPLLEADIEAIARLYLARTRATTWALRVHEVLTDGHLHATVSARAVASRLEISERTLSRRLQNEGVRFRDVLDQALSATAKRLLTSGAVTVDAVAEHLGYSDRRAFDRAFQRWTHTTPAGWRTALSSVHASR
jgi:AraC-like DNA-binding protein